MFLFLNIMGNIAEKENFKISVVVYVSYKQILHSKKLMPQALTIVICVRYSH